MAAMGLQESTTFLRSQENIDFGANKSFDHHWLLEGVADVYHVDYKRL